MARYVVEIRTWPYNGPFGEQRFVARVWHDGTSELPSTIAADDTDEERARRSLEELVCKYLARCLDVRYENVEFVEV